MGFFGLFSSNNSTAGKKSDYSLETIKANVKRQQDESNRELLAMQKADEKYKEDGDKSVLSSWSVSSMFNTILFPASAGG